MYYVSPFKKNKVIKKKFKKSTFLIKNVNFEKNIKIGLRSLIDLYHKYDWCGSIKSSNFKNVSDGTILNINQKTSNTKASITLKGCLNTFSIGTVMQYFKVKQGKYIRRSLKGVKIFLNFLKVYFMKKSQDSLKNKGNSLFIQINGFDFNINYLRKSLKSFTNNNENNVYLLLNLKVSFTKKKDKKVKSIKKRLKKKMILDFLKGNKSKQ